LSKVVAISSSKDDDQKPDIKKASDFELPGGLEDEVEIDGIEREAAIASPIKRKKRLTSAACFDISILIVYL
jgi:hypothetical protein